MPSPLRHDFFRTLRSMSVIISIAVIIGLSLALIPLANLTSSVVFTGSGGQTVMYYYGGSQIHLLGYSYNTYGQPIQGTAFNFTVTTPSETRSASSTTNSSGFATWSVQFPNPNATLSYTLKVNGLLITQGLGGPVATDGEPSLVGGNPTPLVTDPSNSSRVDALFVYEGANGTLPVGYKLYYNYSVGFTGGPLYPSQMTLLGTSSGYITTFKLPPPPSGDNTVTVAAYDANGTQLSASSQSVNLVGFAPPSPTALFTSFASSILALVIPLMAILVAYNSYGKDRATGVLDSVLTRPVTRRGLGLTRYLSIVFSLALAIALCVGAMAAISQAFLGATVPLAFAVSSVGGLVVEAAAFVGIMMLFSRLVKSTGGLIGVGVVIWLVLDFLWGLFILVAALATRVQLGSGDYLALSIRSSFANPAQFYSLVGEYLNGISLVSGIGGSTPISPATYGVTPLTLGAAAAFWVLVPLAGFLYMAVKRD